MTRLPAASSTTRPAASYVVRDDLSAGAGDRREPPLRRVPIRHRVSGGIALPHEPSAGIVFPRRDAAVRIRLPDEIACRIVLEARRAPGAIRRRTAPPLRVVSEPRRATGRCRGFDQVAASVVGESHDGAVEVDHARPAAGAVVRECERASRRRTLRDDTAGAVVAVGDRAAVGKGRLRELPLRIPGPALAVAEAVDARRRQLLGVVPGFRPVAVAARDARGSAIGKRQRCRVRRGALGDTTAWIVAKVDGPAGRIDDARQPAVGCIGVGVPALVDGDDLDEVSRGVVTVGDPASRCVAQLGEQPPFPVGERQAAVCERARAGDPSGIVVSERDRVAVGVGARDLAPVAVTEARRRIGPAYPPLVAVALPLPPAVAFEWLPVARFECGDGHIAAHDQCALLVHDVDPKRDIERPASPQASGRRAVAIQPRHRKRSERRRQLVVDGFDRQATGCG